MQVQIRPARTSFDNQFENEDDYGEDFEDYLQAINNSSLVEPNKNNKQKQLELKNNINKSIVKQDKKNKQEKEIRLSNKNQIKHIQQQNKQIQQNNKKFDEQGLDQNQFHTNSYLNLVANNQKITKQSKQANKNDEDKQDKQSKIKQTITKLTKNILVSKQQIVNEINRITQYFQQNQKSLKQQEESQKKVHGIGLKKNIYKKQQNELIKQKYKQNPQLGSRLPIKSKVQEKHQLSKQQQMKKREEQRKIKKQIFAQQKLARKQQQYIEKDKQKLHKNELQKRIVYQQKFVSRKPSSKQVKISPQQIKAFQNAFIQQIKQRLNIGKSKNRAKSLGKGLQKVKNTIPKDDKKKNYNMKLNKGNKLKQKILQNIRHKMEEQIIQGPLDEFQPTHESILLHSKQFEDTPVTPKTPEKKRVYKSAPQLRLPLISQRNKLIRRTFYDKSQKERPKVHILKLSDE